MNRYCYEDGLVSERLMTKWLSEDEVQLWAAFFDDPEATLYVPQFNLSNSEETARFWIERQRTRYANQRYGLQALFEKATGEFVGLSGLVTQDVDGESELEVGYHILKRHWGKGFAPEAAKLFMDYAHHHQLAKSLISIIDVENMKSQRVAEKNGLTREKATLWNGLNVFIYRIQL